MPASAHQAEKDLAALQALQQPRLRATQARLDEAAQLYLNAVGTNRQQEFDSEALGFEFTVEQIELRALDLQPDLFDDYWAEQATAQSPSEPRPSGSGRTTGS